MDSEERKRKFVIVLESLLSRDCDGVQARLAEKLKIRTSRISRWLAGTVDPINIETLVFSQIAALKGCSNEELAKELGFFELTQDPSGKFRRLLEQILSNKTQEQLGERLKISQQTISSWLNPEINVDPAKISAGTMFFIAHEQRWQFDDLLVYLGLKKDLLQEGLLSKTQFPSFNLSLQEQLKLLISLSNSIEATLNEQKTLLQGKINHVIQADGIELRFCNVCIIIEKEDLAIASNYTGNLVVKLQFNPNNISIVAISNLPKSYKEFDIIIFDISNSNSKTIAIIENIAFDGATIVFAPADFPEKLRSHLKDKVTDIVVKPLDWDSLKNKPYFTST